MAAGRTWHHELAVYWTHAVSSGGFRIDGAGDFEPAQRPHDRRRVCRLLPAVRRLLRGVHGGGGDHHHAAELLENRRTERGDRNPAWDLGEERRAWKNLRSERRFPVAQWRSPIAGRLLDSQGSHC